MGKIEEVARAIREELPRGSTEYLGDDQLQRAARAAIAAMREPTETMLMRGGNVPGAFQGTGAARGNAGDKFRAMIDGALEERE